MKKICLLLALILFPAFVTLGEPLPEPTLLTVTYMDVGQGDAILVLCDGCSMVIDGGDYTYSDRVLATLDKFLPEKRIDYMISTHPHNDHVCGLDDILSNCTVGKVYSPVTDYDQPGFRYFAQTLRKKKKSLTVPPSGLTLSLGPAEVTFLSDGKAYMSENDRSLIVRVVYGDTSFLFMGDAEAVAEESLLLSGQELRSTVLKVGHHGSSAAATDALLSAVQPESAVISVGQGNDFGHPDESTLQRLQVSGATVYRTDLHGTVTAISDGSRVTFITEREPVTGGETP